MNVRNSYPGELPIMRSGKVTRSKHIGREMNHEKDFLGKEVPGEQNSHQQQKQTKDLSSR